MVSALLIAGIVSVLAGLLAIVYGFFVQAFSLGNTLIVSGATAVCTGMLLVGIWVIVGELRTIARRLAPGALAEPRGRAVLPPPGAAQPRSAEGGFLFSRDEPATQPTDGLDAAAPVSPQPWQDEPAPRERPRLPPLPELAPEPAPPLPRAARERLPPTRRERERTPPRVVEPLASEAGGATVTEAATASFENAWPKSERERAREPAPARRSGRTSSRFTEPPREDRSAATIIKSGVVDGMAYSLYSDGSIEAQMPEGMMRFDTIEELRAHLDQH